MRPARAQPHRHPRLSAFPPRHVATAFLLVCCTLFLGPALFAEFLPASAAGAAFARSHDPASASLGEPVRLAALPAEAQRTARLIHVGGPFPFDQDGVVFGNRERRLARQPRGFYHEYTVPTPGSHDRGARRIVCGGRVLTEPEACFYTEDHYGSFHLIVMP
jgi:ribonuclease T1